MDGYQLLSMLHEDEQLHLRVFDLATTERKGEFVLKQYTCSTYEDADRLVKDAITQAREPFPLWAALVAIRLAPVADSKDFTVNFVYRKFQKEFYIGVMTKNDRDGRRASGLQGYEKRGLLAQKKGEISMKVNEAWARDLQREVVIKTFSPIFDVTDANLPLKEAFVQAQVDHPNNCRILDVAICPKKDWAKAFKLHLIIEKLSKDMHHEISKRKGRQTAYSEDELLTFLSQVTAGLIQAKAKPSNIFICADGTYKVGDFGSAWEKTLLTLTSSYAGTIVYLSPEMRQAHLERTELDPFASDVYSLAVTVLHIATLKVPKSLNTEDLAVLRTRVTSAVQSLQYSAGLKTLISDMLHVDPRQRPILEAVSQTVSAMLGKPILGDAGRLYGAMTRDQLAIEEQKAAATIRTLRQSAGADAALADCYLQAAKVAQAQSDFWKAEDFALQCSALREQTLGPTHTHTADAHSFTAFLYHRDMGRAAAAEPLCLHSLRIYEASGSPGDIAETCLSLCEIYTDLGKFAEAEAFGVRSQRTHEQIYGRNSAHTALAYNALGMVYWKTGRLADAERLAQQHLAITQATYSDCHVETAASYANLHLVNFAMRRWEEAERCALKSLQIKEMVHGDHHLSTAKTCGSLCALYRETGRLQDAEKFGVRCLSICQRAYGEAHPEVADAAVNLAAVYRDAGRGAQAEEVARRAVQICEAVAGVDPCLLAAANDVLEEIAMRRSAVSSQD